MTNWKEIRTSTHAMVIFVGLIGGLISNSARSAQLYDTAEIVNKLQQLSLGSSWMLWALIVVAMIIDTKFGFIDHAIKESQEHLSMLPMSIPSLMVLGLSAANFWIIS